MDAYSPLQMAASTAKIEKKSFLYKYTKDRNRKRFLLWKQKISLYTFKLINSITIYGGEKYEEDFYPIKLVILLNFIFFNLFSF